MADRIFNSQRRPLVDRWQSEMNGALNLVSPTDDLFFMAAMQMVMAIQLWHVRRKRLVRVKTSAEKKARPENRPGRKSSKAVPSWQSSYFNELLNTESIKDPASVKGKEFRRLFRAPYAVVKWMADLAHEKQFDLTAAKSAFGVPSIPLILKIMCVLWCLGHSGSFADLRSQAGISEQAFGKFFRNFTRQFVELLLDVWVRQPSEADLRATVEEYARLGFNGCCGSVDCTHFGWDRCPRQFAHAHTGSKGRPTLSYQAVCNHVGYCFSITAGFCGAANDMTIATFDTYIHKMRNDSFFTDFVFELLNRTGGVRLMKGLYLI